MGLQVEQKDVREIVRKKRTCQNHGATRKCHRRGGAQLAFVGLASPDIFMEVAQGEPLHLSDLIAVTDFRIDGEMQKI